MKTHLTVLLICTIVIISLLCGTHDVSAQSFAYRQSPFWGPLRYEAPTLTIYPQLSSGMPIDILEGYIIFDSIARSVPNATLFALSKNLTYSDTLRQAAKFFYELDDYDPILFSQYIYSQYVPGIIYPSYGPKAILRLLQKNIVETIPDSLHLLPFFAADYIAHVKVTNVFNSTTADTLTPYHTYAKVSCTVLDPIKGHVFPSCISDTFYTPSRVRHGDNFSVESPCLQFYYMLEWPRLNHSDLKSSTDSSYLQDGRQWIEVDSEYIVFLNVFDLGRDSIHNFFTIRPSILPSSTTGGMYPVRGGIVYNPYNDYDLGTGLTVAQFKDALRAKIYSIQQP